MISAPTDRLHKFLAVGGLALLLTSVTTAVQKYQEAEAQRIEAIAKGREVQFAAMRYSDHVNRMARIQSDALTRGLSGDAYDAAKNQFFALHPEAEILGREAEKLIVDLSKQAQLAVHMERMRDLWFGLASLGAVLGTWMTFVGLRQWLAVPRNER